MVSESFSSYRNLENERLTSYLIIAAGVILAIFFVVLQLIFGETLVAYLVFFVGGSLLIFIIGIFNLREKDYLINVILSETQLTIEKQNHKSENSVNKFDWISIKNLELAERYVYNRPEYNMKLTYISNFTNDWNVKVFPLRKYNGDPKKQRLLYKRISAFWENLRHVNEKPNYQR